MIADIDRDEVRALVAAGAPLIDVLPRSDYEREHIAGAISIPLARIAAEADRLAQNRPVVVYCHDGQ